MGLMVEDEGVEEEVVRALGCMKPDLARVRMPWRLAGGTTGTTRGGSEDIAGEGTAWVLHGGAIPREGEPRGDVGEARACMGVHAGARVEGVSGGVTAESRRLSTRADWVGVGDTGEPGGGWIHGQARQASGIRWVGSRVRWEARLVGAGCWEAVILR